LVKKVLILCLIISLLCGCNSNKTINNPNYIMRVANYPVGSYSNIYLFNLESDGTLSVSYGEGIPNKMQSGNFIKDDNFITKQAVQEKVLSKIEFDELKKLIDEVHSRDVISVNNYQLDGIENIILINDKIYSFYEGEYTNDCFGKFIIDLKKYSPMNIK